MVHVPQLQKPGSFTVGLKTFPNSRHSSAEYFLITLVCCTVHCKGPHLYVGSQISPFPMKGQTLELSFIAFPMFSSSLSGSFYRFHKGLLSMDLLFLFCSPNLEQQSKTFISSSLFNLLAQSDQAASAAAYGQFWPMCSNLISRTVKLPPNLKLSPGYLSIYVVDPAHHRDMPLHTTQRKTTILGFLLEALLILMT